MVRDRKANGRESAIITTSSTALAILCVPTTMKRFSSQYFLSLSNFIIFCLYQIVSILVKPKKNKEWVLWEHKANTGGGKNPGQWKENMMALCSFSSVEGFWRYMNHLPKPSQVFFDGESRKKVDGKTVEEYSLFKKGIEPEWGDPANITGGEWHCRQHFERDVLDLYWQNLVMGVIGETIDSEDGVINGCRVVDKSRGYPMYKLEIWLKSRDPTVTEEIKDKLLEIIQDGQSAAHKAYPKFDWKDHSA